MAQPHDIQIIAAPSILGLTPGGVERLAVTLICNGLPHLLASQHDIIHVPLLNHMYSYVRDPATQCLNPGPLIKFSHGLAGTVAGVVERERLTVVLGGDCSILIGIMCGLKLIGNYGLIFMDAHADFYQPEKSTTGQAADMDLAIITGRGPELLTNINNLQPYVQDENVVHIAQRDWEETQEYGSQDIKDTAIKCFDLQLIRAQGVEKVLEKVLAHLDTLDVDGFWIHFDADVLNDADNPAVDYRLPGGLSFSEAELLLSGFIRSGKIAGISVTIYNPDLDEDGSIGRNITAMLANAFSNM